jgi:hypothetical protein
MKRTIAGVLLVLGLCAGTMFTEDGWRDRRDIRHDEVRISHDRELRRDVYRGDYRTRAAGAKRTAKGKSTGGICTGIGVELASRNLVIV